MLLDYEVFVESYRNVKLSQTCAVKKTTRLINPRTHTPAVQIEIIEPVARREN